MRSSSKLQYSVVKLWQLSWADRWLLLRVFAVLATYKGLLALFSFNHFIRTATAETSRKKLLSDSDVNRYVWAVRVVSVRIPLGFTCLVQALATKWLLKNHPDVRVCVGVRTNPIDGFSAHAWVTYEHKTILGEQKDQVFEPILAWN